MNPALAISVHQAYHLNRHPWTARFLAHQRRYSFNEPRAWSYSFGAYDGRDGIGWSQ